MTSTQFNNASLTNQEFFRQIFAEWYEKYKDKGTGFMDNTAISRFIYGLTKIPCPKDYMRVKNIQDKYDGDKDGAITLQEFWQFYYGVASGPSLKIVQLNLKHHKVRLDLKNMSEVVEEIDHAEHDMPRYTISAN